MPKFEVVSEFIDKETGKRFYPGNTIDFDDNRAKKLIATGVISGEPLTIDTETDEDAGRELSYQELKVKAKTLGVEGYNKMKKNELEAAIAKVEAE